MITKFLPYEAPEPTERRAREVAAALLRAVGASLDRLAMRLAHVDVKAASAHEPVLEFYAEAGAPEGALYVDGKRVGTLVGVTRL